MLRHLSSHISQSNFGSNCLATRILLCTAGLACAASILLGQQAPPTEPTAPWLAFFQAHSRMLDNASQRAASAPALLVKEQERVAKYFALSPSTHASIIPVTTSFKQSFSPIAVQQKTYRENVQANRQVASRPQFLNMWVQREQIVQASIVALRKALSPKDFSKLRQRVYDEFAVRGKPGH